MFWFYPHLCLKSFKAIMKKYGIFSQLSKWQLFQKLLKDKTCKIDSCELYCTALAGLYFKNWPETVMKITNLVRLRNYGYVLDLVFFEQTKVFFEGGFEYSIYTQWTKHPNSSLIQKCDKIFIQFLGRLKNFRNHFRILLNIVRLCFIQKVDKIGLEVGNFLPLCFSLIMRFDVLVKGAESTKSGHIFSIVWTRFFVEDIE